MGNFGVVYGIQSRSLGGQLGVSEDEAQEYIDGFFDTYKGVDKWMKDIYKQVNKTKFVETLLGRKRRLYEAVDSGVKWKLHGAYRQAGNFCIQGSAADQLKLATVKLQPLLKKLDSEILLFVHDEIIFDCPENIGMENLKEMADVMCNVIQLDCGMKSDIEAGVRWNQRMSEDELEDLRIKRILTGEEDDDEIVVEDE
jgi:DNA polymerase I